MNSISIMMILDVLKEKNSRKIFGKKELDIILKQSEGINLTQSEKNRLSRDIRSKLILVKNLSKFVNDFELRKGFSINKLINSVINLILKDELKDRIKAILLFGSRVNGFVTKRSDVDMCVVFDKISLKEATLFRIRILGEFSTKVDVQVFNILPEKIKREIARKHKVLYKRTDFDNVELKMINTS